MAWVEEKESSISAASISGLITLPEEMVSVSGVVRDRSILLMGAPPKSSLSSWESVTGAGIISSLKKYQATATKRSANKPVNNFFMQNIVYVSNLSDGVCPTMFITQMVNPVKPFQI